jgi:mannosyltransferase OCH1-like enzyme
MAWLMWDDDGVDALVQKYEPGMYQAFSALPYPVEKADAFRVLVLKWFGGVVSEDYECSSVFCRLLTLSSMRTLIPNP